MPDGRKGEIHISFYFRVVVKVVHHFIKQERFAGEQKEGTIYSFIFYSIFCTHVPRECFSLYALQLPLVNCYQACHLSPIKIF